MKPTKTIRCNYVHQNEYVDIMYILESCGLNYDSNLTSKLPAYCIGAWDNDTEEMIGVISACPSYGTSVFIPFFGVMPEYRGEDVGIKLIEKLFNQLIKDGFDKYDAITQVNQDDINSQVLGYFEKLSADLEPGFIIEGRLDVSLNNIKKYAAER